MATEKIVTIVSTKDHRLREMGLIEGKVVKIIEDGEYLMIKFPSGISFFCSRIALDFADV